MAKPDKGQRIRARKAKPDKGQRIRARKDKSDNQYRIRARKDITVRLDLFEWGQSKIEEGKFWNWSHLVEQAIVKLKETSEA